MRLSVVILYSIMLYTIIMYVAMLYDTTGHYYQYVIRLDVLRLDSVLPGHICNMSLYSKGCPSIVKGFLL